MDGKKPPAGIAKYDLKGLLTNLPSMVFVSNPTYYKVASIDAKKDSSEVRLDSLGWANEFQFLTDLKVDHARLQSRYVKETLEENGKTTVYYHAMEPKKEDIDRIQISLSNDMIEVIEIEINTKNSLYASSRNIFLEFDNSQNQMLLKSYRMKGWQHLKSMDTTRINLD